MRTCPHYRAVKGCPECEREPPVLCAHNELKGACPKCLKARIRLVQTTPPVVTSLKKEVLAHAVRWARYMLSDIQDNHGGLLSARQNQALKIALTALDDFLV